VPEALPSVLTVVVTSGQGRSWGGGGKQGASGAADSGSRVEGTAKWATRGIF
jgi:hypothetical protein